LIKKYTIQFLFIFTLLSIFNCEKIDKDCKYTASLGCKKEVGFLDKPLNQAGVLALSTRTTATTAPTFTISGTVTGLIGSGLVLQNNNADDLTLSFGDSTFRFATRTSTYNVTVKTSPSILTCTVTSGTGTATADVTNIVINCSQKTLSLSAVVTTFAGGAGVTGSTDGTGTGARFNGLVGIAYDGSTSLYIGDGGNSCIRRAVISTAAVTTYAGQCGSTGSTDGTGTAARFQGLQGVASDGTNIFVADQNNQIIRRIIASTSVVSTIAGTVSATGTADGTGTAARFNGPVDVTADGTNIYVADVLNHSIRRIVVSTGVVTTLAGLNGTSGTADGTGTAARFNTPRALTTDGTNLYVVEQNNHTLRRVVISTGVVTTLAGTAGASGTTDATGSAARFNGPQGVLLDSTNIYISDTANHSIRRYNISTGAVSTFAGQSGTSGNTDGTGTAARFSSPTRITTDGTSLFVSDSGNHTIRRIQ
jgi:hypothetical protein